MTQDLHRYFIEPQMQSIDEMPRNREALLRRAEAEKFLSKISDWLDGHDFNAHEIRLAITAMGQVQITCDQELMNRLCADDELPIAAVRSGGGLTESLQRIGMR